MVVVASDAGPAIRGSESTFASGQRTTWLLIAKVSLSTRMWQYCEMEVVTAMSIAWRFTGSGQPCVLTGASEGL